MAEGLCDQVMLRRICKVQIKPVALLTNAIESPVRPQVKAVGIKGRRAVHLGTIASEGVFGDHFKGGLGGDDEDAILAARAVEITADEDG